MTSIRRTGAWVALAAAGALALTSCAGAGAGTAGDPVDGGTITVAIDSDPTSALDIHVSAGDITALVLRNVFDSLVVQDPDGSIQPWLADSWEISEDGLQYTFDLKEGVTFTDGEVFDAAAVKANFDHIANPDTASQCAAALLGGDNYLGTEVVDDDTVTVSFDHPYAAFLQAASTAYLGFYSPKVLETSADKLIAGGPGVHGRHRPVHPRQHRPRPGDLVRQEPRLQLGAGEREPHRAPAHPRPRWSTASCRRTRCAPAP